MRWEERLMAVFDDLELQAEGLALAERDAEVAELVRSEYAEVDLVARLHASVGRRVSLAVSGVGRLGGDLVRVGADCCLLADGGQEWVVRLSAVSLVRGVAGRAVPAQARPVTARLRIGSVLRGLAAQQDDVTVLDRDGVARSGRLARIGADFAELAGPAPRDDVELVPFTAIAAVRRG